MSSRNASRLASNLIARKGDAAPAVLSPVVPALTVPAPVADSMNTVDEVRVEAGRGTPAPLPARGLHGTIAVTVRLDPGRYERLKVHGARLRRTNQEILVEALDRYFRDVIE